MLYKRAKNYGRAWRQKQKSDEKQKTFDVKLRLSRWAKNSAKWDKPKKAGTSKLDSQISEWEKAKKYIEKI